MVQRGIHNQEFCHRQFFSLSSFPKLTKSVNSDFCLFSLIIHKVAKWIWLASHSPQAPRQWEIRHNVALLCQHLCNITWFSWLWAWEAASENNSIRLNIPAFLCDNGLIFAQRQLSIHPAGVHFLNQACWIFSVLVWPMEMFNHTWQNVGGMCHPGAPRTSLCRDCENSSSHFCCRAIMEHKELLRVPWDWQIGERGLQTQTHTNLDSYTQVILHWSAPTLKPPA